MSLRQVALGMLVAGSAALSGCYDFEEEKLRCEEAMARVLACCPAVTASPMACEYTNNGNGFPLTVYYFPKVECLIGLDCAELADRGACAWAADPAHAPAACP